MPDWSLAPLVTALMALRGVDFIAATTLLGRDRRSVAVPHATRADGLARPGALSEHSTGERVRRGAITKTGNRRARRMLIQCAWSYRHPPRVGSDKLAKVAAAPEAVREIALEGTNPADRALSGAVTAPASWMSLPSPQWRELAAFIWAIARAVVPGMIMTG